MNDDENIHRKSSTSSRQVSGQYMSSARRGIVLFAVWERFVSDQGYSKRVHTRYFLVTATVIKITPQLISESLVSEASNRGYLLGCNIILKPMISSQHILIVIHTRIQIQETGGEDLCVRKPCFAVMSNPI